MAGLLKAVPQNFAYGLSALLESKGGASPLVHEQVEEAAETPAGVEDAAPAVSDDAAAPVAEVAVEEETPVVDVATETTEESSDDASSEPAE
jgi:hypothetical protein